MTIPAREPGEETPEYYKRLRRLRDALRGYLPRLRDQALQEGRSAGLTAQQIAQRLGVSVGWLYRPRDVEFKCGDDVCLPPRRDDEDALAYYTRLNALRDELSRLLPQLIRQAAREHPAVSRSNLAARLGVSEGYLFKVLRGRC